MVDNPFEACLRDLTQVRTRVQRTKGVAVARFEDRDFLKSFAYKWFETYRPQFAAGVPDQSLGTVDAIMSAVLDATDSRTAKATYITAFKEAAHAVVALRAHSLTSETKTALIAAPDFAALATDADMNAILQRRWIECQRCRIAEAPLAATVMMGGLLEALFVARANTMSDKAPLFRAKAVPKNRKTNMVLPLSEWTLSPYLDVAAELGWITRSGKDVAAVLRDYRNYIHPEKERSHGVILSNPDSEMFWDLTKSLTRQLLDSTRVP